MGLSENGLREVVLSKKRIERVAALSQASIPSVLRGSDSYYSLIESKRTGLDARLGDLEWKFNQNRILIVQSKRDPYMGKLLKGFYCIGFVLCMGTPNCYSGKDRRILKNAYT